MRADNRTTRECSSRVTIRSQNAVAAVAYYSSDAVTVMLFFAPLPHTIHGIEASSGRKSLRADGLALLVLRIERAVITHQDEDALIQDASGSDDILDRPRSRIA